MRRFGSRRDGRRTGRGAALLFALLATAVGARAAEPAAPGAAADAPVAVRIGIAPIYPPMAFKENGQIKGVEVDFATAMAKALGVAAPLVELQWEDLIPALLDHRVDVIMSGMSITDERGKSVAFTRPYLQVGQMALMRKEDLGRLASPSALDLPTTRVGFQRNTTSEIYARGNLKQAILVPLGPVEEGIAALRAHQIDFYVHDAPTIWRYTGRFEPGYDDLAGRYRPLTTEHLAWAVRPEDEALRHRLNALLEKWEKSGRLDDILDEWITVRKITMEVKPAH